MEIDTEALPKHLERKVAPCYVVFGDEPLLVLEATDRIRAAAAAAGYSTREVLTAEKGFDWSQLHAAANSLSLFGDRRIIDLRIPSGAPGNDGSEALAGFAARLPDDAVALVTLPRLDRKQQSAKWFAALAAVAVVVQAQKVTLARLPAWLAGRLAAQGHQADHQTLDFMATRVEGNLLAAHQEVRKLALLFPPGKLSFESVKDAVLDVARYDVWGLGPAVLKGESAHFSRMLEGLRAEGTGLPLVLWALAEEVRALLAVHTASRRGVAVAQVLRDHRVWGERQSLVPQAAKRLDGATLMAALAQAARIDRIAKGVAPGNAWDELRQLGLTLAGAPTALATVESR